MGNDREFPEGRERALRDRTRRHFFVDCGLGMGAMALGSLLAADRPAVAGADRDATPSRRGASPPVDQRQNPLAPTPAISPRGHVASSTCSWRAGRASSSCSTISPSLREYSGRPIPDSFIQGRRFAFMDTFTREHPKLLGTTRRFARHGQSGAIVSELLPHTPASRTS